MARKRQQDKTTSRWPLFSNDGSSCRPSAYQELAPEETKSTISIWFHLSQCTDCGLCERLCPESAISCASVASSKALRATAHHVMHRSLRQCASCARSFVLGLDSAELCITCQNEHDLANDWKAMLIESS